MVFRSAVAVLFGDSLLNIPDGGDEELEHTFFAFEEGFEVFQIRELLAARVTQYMPYITTAHI
jgi:hypothetical protein